MKEECLNLSAYTNPCNEIEKRFNVEIPLQSDPLRPLENGPLDLRKETYIECRLERFFIPTACISDSYERKR